jgi:hypothetical protein
VPPPASVSAVDVASVVVLPKNWWRCDRPVWFGWTIGSFGPEWL